MLVSETVKKNISDVRENKIADNMILTAEESVYFKDEINKQLAKTKIIDIGKAMNNARYLARLDQSFANIESGRWTEHELIEDDDDE